ncbi:MAG: hypothetical protein QOI47_1904, partial [Actinomycetota bacterium]|nr:hypothetical protein [Actinomycetota bacterium]
MTVVDDLAPTTAAAPAVAPAEPVSSSRRQEWLALGAVLAVALALNTWGLSGNGLGNTYYAAAVRSMTHSWRNFFFAAFDPGGFISVDKPPVALWIEALFVRAFGYSSWSLLLPAALAGTASVGVLWAIVRRRFGVVAATVAGLVLALSPINVALNRLNLPDPFMILFLLGAVWAVDRSFDAARPYRALVVAGALVGLAFNTKMLAAAIPLPAIGLALLIGSRRDWWTRVRRGAVFAVAAIAFSLPWLVAVDLTPASSRPFVGGSTDNTVQNLVLGYNGVNRVTGTGQGGIGRGRPTGAPGAPGAGAGGVFGGTAGSERLFSDAVGGQIAWLLPVATASALVALWCYRRRAALLAGVALWTGWVLLHGVVFSESEGIFHSYYTTALAPGIAALVGIGGALAYERLRAGAYRAAWAGGTAAVLAITIALHVRLTRRAPGFHAWTRPAALALALGAAAALIVSLVRRQPRAVPIGLGLALAASLVSPAAWAA